MKGRKKERNREEGDRGMKETFSPETARASRRKNDGSYEDTSS